MIDGFLDLYFWWLLIYSLIGIGWILNIALFLYISIRFEPPKYWMDWVAAICSVIVPYGLPGWYLVEAFTNGD